jgi:hypothetical protein
MKLAYQDFLFLDLPKTLRTTLQAHQGLIEDRILFAVAHGIEGFPEANDLGTGFPGHLGFQNEQAAKPNLLANRREKRLERSFEFIELSWSDLKLPYTSVHKGLLPALGQLRLHTSYSSSPSG